MSALIAIAYPDENRAAEVITVLQRMSKNYLLDLADAVYVTKGADGKVKLHQSNDTTAGGAVSGALWGGIIGLLFLAPFAGAAIGAGMGALIGKFSDYGIDDNFMKQLSATMQPNTSAIFVLAHKVAPDKVLPELGKYGGKVLHTSLNQDAEARLQNALDQGAQAPVEVVYDLPSATP